jgi:hypothetical protein
MAGAIINPVRVQIAPDKLQKMSDRNVAAIAEDGGICISPRILEFILTT